MDTLNEPDSPLDAMSDSSFHSLIEAALSGRLSGIEHEQFEVKLRHSAECRDAYLAAAQMHLELNQLASLMELNDGLPTSRQKSIGARLPLRALLALSVSAAAGLLIAFTTGGLFQKSESLPVAGAPSLATQSSVLPTIVEPEDTPPVIVEASQALFFGEGLIPQSGRKLIFKQKYVLTQGMIELEFAAGAKAILDAPCAFAALGAATLQIHSGHCSVHAPPGAEGFQVLSPSAEVIDLGTRFVVNVGQTGETELTVVDGAASLKATQGASQVPVLLREGESFSVELGADPQASSKRLNYVSNLPDRVVRYEATRTPEGAAEDLLSVIVQRGGISMEYPRERLLRSRVTHFQCMELGAGFCVAKGAELPVGEARLALFDSDWSLVTGLANPRLPPEQERLSSPLPVMSVEFAEPIVNGPGPDIVVFDLQLLTQPASGNVFRVRSGDLGAPKKIHLVKRFDIGLNSPYALDLVPYRLFRSVQKIESARDLVVNDFLPHGTQSHVDSKALAVGIDLSSLGLQPGETLTRLDILGVPKSVDTDALDPVLIVGLPAPAGDEASLK